MTPREEKINQFEILAQQVADGIITMDEWNEQVRHELNDCSAEVPDALNNGILHQIFYKYNKSPLIVRVNFTSYLESNGGRINPILDGYRPHMKLDNGFGSDVVFKINSDVIYGGDSCNVILWVLKPITLKSGNTFGIYEGARRIGQGVIL